MRVAAVVGPPAVPAGPALGFATQQVLTVPQQRLLNNWTCRTLSLVASKVPDTVAPIVASINNLRQDLTTINADRRDEEEEKARMAALPQSFAKRFGTPVCKEVMRYVEVLEFSLTTPLPHWLAQVIGAPPRQLLSRQMQPLGLRPGLLQMQG